MCFTCGGESGDFGVKSCWWGGFSYGGENGEASIMVTRVGECWHGDGGGS